MRNMWVLLFFSRANFSFHWISEFFLGVSPPQVFTRRRRSLPTPGCLGFAVQTAALRFDSSVGFSSKSREHNSNNSLPKSFFSRTTSKPGDQFEYFFLPREKIDEKVVRESVWEFLDGNPIRGSSPFIFNSERQAAKRCA